MASGSSAEPDGGKAAAAAKVAGLWPEDVEAGWLERLKNPLNLGIMALISEFKPHDGYLLGDDICIERMTLEQAKETCLHLPHCKGFCYFGSPFEKGVVQIWFKGTWQLDGPGKGCTSWRVIRDGESGPGRPIGFVHHLPDRPFLYGSWFGRLRAPVVFIEAHCKDLTEYIRSDPCGPFGDGKATPSLKPNWQDWGFVEDKERVWKTEWHALPVGSEEADILIPRLGKRGSVSRAPPRVEAFAEAFRNVNREAWSCIHDRLVVELERRSMALAHRDVKGLANCILDQTHFGVIEAQVRWGDEELKLPSHVDGSTSMLHLGLTLGGDRTVRLGVFPKEDSVGNMRGVDSPDVARLDPNVEAWETDVWDEKVWKREHLKELPMTRGCAYLSSPFCCEHAVKYKRCSQEDPIIALQFRFAFKGEYGLSVNWVRNDDMHVVTKVIAGVLKVAGDSGYLRMPCLEELQAAEERLKKAAASRARLRRLKEKREQQAAAPSPGAAASKAAPAQGVAASGSSSTAAAARGAAAAPAKAVAAPARAAAAAPARAAPRKGAGQKQAAAGDPAEDVFFAGLPFGGLPVHGKSDPGLQEIYGGYPGQSPVPAQSRVGVRGYR